MEMRWRPERSVGLCFMTKQFIPIHFSSSLTGFSKMESWTWILWAQHVSHSGSDDGMLLSATRLQGFNYVAQIFCRGCPGRHMAESAVWITIASILAAFNITKAVDENGEVIEPSYEYVSFINGRVGRTQI